MDQLLRNAEVKQREDMVVLQKKLQRELEAEKAMYALYLENLIFFVSH